MTAIALFVGVFSRFLNMTDMTSRKYSRMSTIVVSLPAGTACTYHASLAVPLISNPTHHFGCPAFGSSCSGDMAGAAAVCLGDKKRTLYLTH